MRIKYISKRILEFVQIISRVTKLLWNSSHSTFVKLIVVNIISGVTVPITLIIWKYLINDMGKAIISGNMKMVLAWLLIYFGMNYLENVMQRISSYYQNILSSYLNQYTSDIILDKIKNTDLKYFDNSETYDKVRKVNEESTGRSISLLSTITSFVQNFSSLLGTVTVLANLNIGLLVLCITICVPTLIISMQMAVTQYDIYTERYESLRFISYLKDIVTSYENIKEMKIYHIHDYFRRHIFKKYEEYISTDKKIRKRFCKKLSLTDFGEELVILLFKIYITVKIIVDKMTIGDFLLYINSIDNFRGATTSILNTIASIFEDGLYIQNLFEFLDMDSTEMKNGRIKFNPEFKEIEFRNVWFRYPESKKYILQDVSFKLSSGCCHAIVGLNGSGKTTIVKLLLNLYTPEKGEIFVDGINLKDIDNEEFQKNFGVVFQDFVKYPLTVRENIGCGNLDEIDNLDLIYEAANKSKADEFIQHLPEKYDTQLHREWSDGTEISLGQWQKIAISRVFMKKFPIVILDEPTASLDPRAEYALYEQFRELMDGRTSILIAHRFSTVKLANKILVLQNGRIIEEGTHTDLIKLNKEYAALFKMQAKMYQEDV